MALLDETIAAGQSAHIADHQQVAKKLNAVIDVKADFAATGDGVTNDTTAIQDAINAASTAGGGTVYFPKGTYLVTNLLPKSGVDLIGAGWTSIIKLKNSANPSVAVIGNAYTDTAISNVRIANLAVDGNKANNTSGSGVYLHGGTNIVYENLYIHDCCYGSAGMGAVTASQVTGAGKFRIVNCWSHNPAEAGNFWGHFFFTGGEHVTMRGNIATDDDGHAGYAYDVEPNASWVVSQVLIADNTAEGSGIVVTASGGSQVNNGVVITGNLLHCQLAAGAGPALKVVGVDGRVVVANNDALGPSHTSAVLHLENLDRPVVTGNRLSGMGAAQNTDPSNVGILLHDMAAGHVGENYIAATAATHATAVAGISETGTTGDMVYGVNHFYNITVPGKQRVDLNASTATSGASIRLPHGVAPTSPSNGDIWTTTNGLFIRVNGSTVGAAPDSADQGFIGTPLGWVENTAAIFAANRCDYYEVPPPLKTRTITDAWYYCSTSAVINICIGIYNVDTGARIATTGSFALPGTGLRKQALSASVEIAAGTRLYVALSADGTGASFYGGAGFMQAFFGSAAAGLRRGGNKATGQFPLPATVPTFDSDAIGRAFAVMFT